MLKKLKFSCFFLNFSGKKRSQFEVSIKMDNPEAEIMEIAKAVSRKLAQSPSTSEMGIKASNNDSTVIHQNKTPPFWHQNKTLFRAQKLSLILNSYFIMIETANLVCFSL